MRISTAPSFNKAERELTDEGYKVFNPASIKGKDHWKWEDYMKVCIAALPSCGSIYLLKGWEGSQGATIEVGLANILGIDIILEGAK